MKNIFKTEKGMSLVELIVAMGILVIVSTGLSAFFVTIWKSKFNEVEMGKSLLISSQAVNKMMKNIRQADQADSGAYLIGLADDFELTFYANIDEDEDIERVHYYLEGSELKLGTADPITGINPTYPPENVDVISVVAKNIVNTSTEPIFTYYDNNYTALTTPASVYPIRFARISIAVNTNPNKISDVVISSLASFRNVDN